MKQLVYVLVAATTWLLASCGEAFFENDSGEMTTKSSSLRALDISTTNITAMTEADFQALDAAMERLGVEYDGRFHIIQRTDYRNLNISKNLYWAVKQICENGNRMSASIHHVQSFPLIKNRNSECGGPNLQTDCMAYALYGMGADLSLTLSYIHQYHPDGVSLSDLDAVVYTFLPNANRVPHPSSDGQWLLIPRPIVICAGNLHAVNCVRYTLSSGSALIIDRQQGTSGGVLGPNEIYCFFE